MTRYPVHVGSIPAYQLREMDRINEPYRKERAMSRAVNPDGSALHTTPMTDEPVDGLREAREALLNAVPPYVSLERWRWMVGRLESAALTAAPAEDRGGVDLNIHGYTCGICSWGRGSSPRSEEQYESHMAHAHPQSEDPR